MNGASMDADAAGAAVRTSLQSGMAARDSADGASSRVSTDSSRSAGPLPVEPQRPKVVSVSLSVHPMQH